ncbi:MAG: hypothetical protein IKP24_02775 [Alphaproteobacteria bacterium]|nr:hypothetical protein [Alphaproteobacteria bacterium]
MKKNTKGDKLFSTTDNIILITTIVLCLGLEVASVLPVVQDKIYETKYNKLIEQGHTEWYATINAKSQTQSARTALYFGGLGAGLIGIGALRIKKSRESERAFKKIMDEYNHTR